MAEGAHRRSLASRLAATFVGVAVLSTLLMVGIVVLTSRHESSSVASSTRTQTARSAAEALARAYTVAGGDWAAVDPRAAGAIAADARAGLVVRDADGRVVATTTPSGAVRPGGGRLPGGPQAKTATAPVLVAGRQVGTVQARFAGTGLTAGERRVRDTLVRNAIIAAVLAALVALAAAAYVTRLLQRPLGRLAGAARALAAGDDAARVAAPDAPGELGEVAVAFDQMADTLAAQQRARVELLSDLAHELRTPVTVLRGTLEEVVDEERPVEPARLAGLAEEVLRLQRLVEDLWAVADSEPAFVQLERAEVDLADVVSVAVAAMEPRAREAGVEVRVASSPAPLVGDRRRLRQIVDNLLLNALKFAADGRVVDVEAGLVEDDVRLEVADRGPGIPEDERAHVFDRFWRGSDAAGVGGTGVGLAVVKRLTEAHGGRVSVHAREGGGTRFVVVIPAA